MLDPALPWFFAQWLVGFALVFRYFIVSDEVDINVKPQEGFGEGLCAFVCAFAVGWFINAIFIAYGLWWLGFRSWRRT